jgi:hypothetical protein
MERFFSLYKVIRKGIISPFLLLILIPQALKIGVDEVVRISVLFVVEDEIYIKTLLGVGDGDLFDRRCSCCGCGVQRCEFKGANGVSGFYS